MGFDDLAAVLTVAHTPGWAIDGLSLVAGNAPIATVVDNALRSAHFFDWDFPIYRGRAQPLKGDLVTAQNILGADAMRSAGKSLPLARKDLSPGDALAAMASYLRKASEPTTLLALGPLTNVAAIVDSGILKIAKPEPGIFTPALEALGTDPSRTLYVGDTVHADVVGATRAAMPVVQLDPLGLHHDLPHTKATGVAEVVALLGR